MTSLVALPPHGAVDSEGSPLTPARAVHRDVVPDVAVLVWPAQAHEVERLRRQAVPRLLLVPAGAAPPQEVDHLTEWVRAPASEHEVAARVVALVRRAGTFPAGPRVDEHGRITYRERWSALSPIESRIAAVLCDRFCQVVSTKQLRSCAWPPDHPARPPSPAALRVHLHRLRHRVAELGLEVVTVRNEGVVLQPGAPKS